mmetsp:Transcript_44112/g.136168  ORF Transcript_44112/g.136168 Transcript_44112/m.136168 type:complete len:398 (-) Transcript_44112:65-1258(-)
MGIRRRSLGRNNSVGDAQGRQNRLPRNVLVVLVSAVRPPGTDRRSSPSLDGGDYVPVEGEAPAAAPPGPVVVVRLALVRLVLWLMTRQLDGTRAAATHRLMRSSGVAVAALLNVRGICVWVGCAGREAAGGAMNGRRPPESQRRRRVGAARSRSSDLSARALLGRRWRRGLLHLDARCRGVRLPRGANRGRAFAIRRFPRGAERDGIGRRGEAHVAVGALRRCPAVAAATPGDGDSVGGSTIIRSGEAFRRDDVIEGRTVVLGGVAALPEDEDEDSDAADEQHAEDAGGDRQAATTAARVSGVVVTAALRRGRAVDARRRHDDSLGGVQNPQIFRLSLQDRVLIAGRRDAVTVDGGHRGHWCSFQTRGGEIAAVRAVTFDALAVRRGDVERRHKAPD